MGHECLIWSAIYDKSFAPYYLPMNWRLKEWRKYYSESFRGVGDEVASLIDVEKWRARVNQLAKQEWDSTDRESLLHDLLHISFSLVDRLKPDLFLSWNTLCPHTGVSYDICESLQIPAILIERAVFPHTWFIEPGGLVGKSCIAGVPLDSLVPPKERIAYREIGKEYLDSIAFESYNRYSQVQESKEMEKIKSHPLASKRPRIVLFPPDDGTLGFVPSTGADRRATLPHFTDSFDAAKRLSTCHDGITIFKPHPSFLERTFDTTGYPNLFVIDYDFRRLIEWADIVASTGSGLEFVAAGMDKPVLLLANDILSGKGVAYEAQDPVDMKTAILRSLGREDRRIRQHLFHEFVGYLMTEFLVSSGDATPPFRRPKDVVDDLCRRYLSTNSISHSHPQTEIDDERAAILSPDWSRKLQLESEEVRRSQRFQPKSSVTDRRFLIETLNGSQGLHIVLDFDYTLFLNNSTDAFLSNVCPKWLVFFIITISDSFLRMLSRHRLVNYDKWRDFLRVAIVSFAIPWSVLMWRLRSKRLIQEFQNAELVDAVRSCNPSRITVLSFGFHHLLDPLISQIALPIKPFVICSRIGFRPLNLRKKGKVRELRPHLRPPDLPNALFVTDSKDDIEVLNYIPQSFLLQWSPYFEKPFGKMYFPLRYTLEGKYPQRRYFLNQIIKEDLILVLLAYQLSWDSAIAIVCLFFSFLTVYEIGYYHNDQHSAKMEAKPTLSESASGFVDYPISRAYLWSTILSILGVLVLLLSNGDDLKPLVRPFNFEWKNELLLELINLLVVWGFALVTTLIVFKWFNRLRPHVRIYLFPLLHLLKAFVYSVMIPIAGVLGWMILIAQVMIQTMTYNIYRHGGVVSSFNRQAYRLEVFGVLLLAYLISVESSENVLLDWRLPLIGIWSAFRGVERAYGGGWVKKVVKAAWRSIASCIRV